MEMLLWFHGFILHSKNIKKHNCENFLQQLPVQLSYKIGLINDESQKHVDLHPPVLRDKAESPFAAFAASNYIICHA